MISLDPPLNRDATTDWINPTCGYDAEELLRFQEDPDNSGNAQRFARHLLDSDPENVWALRMLAISATTSTERMLLLREVVRIGLHLWRDHLVGKVPQPNWLRDTEARLFLVSLSNYGLALGKSGKHSDAKECLALLSKLDRGDKLGSVAAFKRLGITLSQHEHRPTVRRGP